MAVIFSLYKIVVESDILNSSVSSLFFAEAWTGRHLPIIYKVVESSLSYSSNSSLFLSSLY